MERGIKVDRENIILEDLPIGLGLDPHFGKLKVRHPSSRRPRTIRVVNLADLNRIEGDFGRLSYELPQEDKMYLQMQIHINAFYSSLMKKDGVNLQRSLVKPRVPVVLQHFDGSFQRAEIKSKIKDEVHDVASVVLLDKDLPVLTVRLRSLYYLDKMFSRLPPRIRYFTLHGLSFYKDAHLFQRILLSACEDIFTGALKADFIRPVRVPEVDVHSSDTCRSSKVTDAIVRIHGAKYPKRKFPCGLNGFLVENIISMMGEPRLPEENFKQSGAFVVGGDEGGNVFITFHTEMLDHLQYIIDKLNDASAAETLEKWKGRVDLPLSPGDIYLAPYVDDGYYYRAKYLDNKTPLNDPLVNVLFIDYGTVAAVSVEDLILARNIDYLLGIFPSMAVQAHLVGVEFMSSERLAEIIDPSELCVVKTLRKFSSPNLAEVEVRRQTSNQSEYQSINEEIAVTIGTGSSKTCLTRIKELTQLVILGPCNFPKVMRCNINTRLIIWSALDDPIKMLKPENNYTVKITTTSEPDNVVLTPLNRFNLLEQLEKEMSRNRGLPWKKATLAFSEIKLNDFFSYWWQEEKKVVRVRLMESWEHLNKIQGSGYVKTRPLNVFLIDYGIKKHVLLQELSLLEVEFCRYPPFAISATIVAPKRFSPSNLKASFYQRILNGKTFKAHVDKLSFDPFDVPHATVKLIDLSLGIEL